MYTADREKVLSASSLLKRAGLGLLIIFAFALLSACGGGSGGGGASVNTGKFIDAPTQGLGYSTATQNGTTDNQGSFRCEAGEQITFSIGDVVLGTTLCKSIITPLDLVPGAADETNPTVTNILRLLQSLDDDCDLDNIIYITPQIASEVSGRPINFNTSVENFNNGEVADLFDYLNGLGAFTCDTPRDLRSAEESQEHFRQVMDEPADPTILAALFNITPETIFVLEPATFDAAESTGNINEFTWDFGDGEEATGVETNHTYAATGTYLVTLTVIDKSGKEVISSQEIEVNEPPNKPPEVSLMATPMTGPAPLYVRFNASASSDPDGSITNFKWEFGDGKSFTSMNAKPTHTFYVPGKYITKVTVTDDDGEKAVKTIEIEASGPPPNQAPVASFIATPETGEAILQVSFNATGSSDSDGTIFSYTWDFGDGETGFGAIRNHSYSEWGNYLAKLTVTDNDGSTDEATKEVTVLETVGDADCSSNPCDVNATCDDSGAEITCTCKSGWTGNGFSCSLAVECENNDTLPSGGGACGLNNRGELGLICVNGDWQDNPGTCTDPDVCTDDSVTEGSTVCGLNDNGTLMQECVTGQWTDSDDCDNLDICANGTTQKGPTPCSGGYYMQLCENGQWGDTTDCVLDEDDEDGDLVDAGDDPNDADNTVCGDSDSDGCDDCSVAGIFDPANDGWDEDGDGICELSLDYDCMNGANAASDPYRRQACVMFSYVNHDRALFAAESGNAAPAVWNEDIWEVAVAHSIDMCENSFWGHQNPSGQYASDRAAANGLPYLLNENIAANFDSRAALNNFMLAGKGQYNFMLEGTCSGHRRNILNPQAIEVGIGYYICDNSSSMNDGYHLMTQNFRPDFSIAASAYCQVSSNVCQVPPNPPTTATCPEYALDDCPTPTAGNTDFRYCN